MFRIRWLGSILETGSSRKARRRLAAQKRKPIRLMLESLEERLTPSGGQTAGSYSALTTAIAADTAANTNYVIQITNSFTFDSGGQVSISKLGSGSTLTLSGQNGTNYTLTGNGNRLFDVASGQTVTFADLTLTGGSVTNSKGNAQGGAILDQGGNVTLSNMIVRDNTVKGVGAPGGVLNAGGAEGGGVYASGAGALSIRDSILSDNSAQGVPGADGTAPGMDGGFGGSAWGGGLYVTGSGWKVTLTGDTLSGNTAIGGSGGNGVAGGNATAPNASGGHGGYGGSGGWANGGAAYFYVSGEGGGSLTILNDLSAPLSHPSIMIDNSAQGGVGGNGGNGGASTGTAPDSSGGQGGGGGYASGGGLSFYSAADFPKQPVNITIGNSSFYANKAAGGNDGLDGQQGTGGKPNTPYLPISQPGEAGGGGLSLLTGDGTATLVNNTVAANSVTGGVDNNGGRGAAGGGGISYSDVGQAAVVLDNNTITQNSLEGGSDVPMTPSAPGPSPSGGAGGIVWSSVPSHLTLLNNLIQNNRSINSSASDFEARQPFGPWAGSGSPQPLPNASNNFIATMSANAVSTKTNIVGNTQVQLGNVVGVDAKGNPTGGPIYYPLLPGVISIGAGSSSALNIIAGVEGTTAANATDEIGNPLFHNGTIDLGAVQTVTALPLSPVLSPFQLVEAIILDTDALIFQNIPPALSFLNALSEQALGLPLPATADLIPTIEGDFAALMDILVGTIEGTSRPG